MWFPSVTFIISGLFLAYFGHSLWTIYGLFYPEPCLPKATTPSKSCIKSYLHSNAVPRLQLSIYTSQKQRLPKLTSKPSYLQTLWISNNFTFDEDFEKVIDVDLPIATRRNGSLYAHIYVHPVGTDLFQSPIISYAVASLTSYSVPQAATFNLMGSKGEGAKSVESVIENSSTEPESKGAKGAKLPSSLIPVAHLRSRLALSLMTDDIAFDRYQTPGDVFHFLLESPAARGFYLPILYIDELDARIRDLVQINESSASLPLTVRYRPISIGKLRMFSQMQEAMRTLQSLGFSEKDTDEVKGIFADTNFYLLMLTFGVSIFHLLFDFLAFKNDVQYWRRRRDMVGLSSRAVCWRSASTFIIFLYLLDEETSLLVLIPCGVSTLIELWKVTKAFKVTVAWNRGWRPQFSLGDSSAKELETAAFDSQAMRYLSYLLYPACVCGAIYSLVYVPHKSWYSWCLQSLVNGVYGLGFLFMLPQLFVNYKLKSVAHLPWRAFMYKAFNTFIDDIFAFIITMPTMHRVACFRDDFVFLVYLYQRWLYPVDRTRVNEYGQSFEEEEDKKKKPEKDKKIN